jgi:hypothetical protein
LQVVEEAALTKAAVEVQVVFLILPALMYVAILLIPLLLALEEQELVIHHP